MRGPKAATVGALCICLSVLTGCWDSADVEEKNIPLAVVTDFRDNKYSFTLEQIKQSLPGNSGKGGGSSIGLAIIYGSGSSLIEARANLDAKADHPIYLGATRIIAFTDAFSQKGISEYVNRIRTTLDYRKTIHIVTTSMHPVEFLSIKPKNDFSVGFDVESISHSLGTSGIAVFTTLGRLLQDISVMKVGYVIPHFGLQGDSLTLLGYSIFKEKKKIGFIPLMKAKGVNYLLSNQKPSGLYTLKIKKNKITVKAVMEKRHITTRYEDDQIKINIQMEFSGMIQYGENPLFITDEDKETIRKKLKRLIDIDINEQLKTSQARFGCDYLDMYRHFRAQNENEFDKLDWNREYAKAKINLSVETWVKPGKLVEVNPIRSVGYE